MSIGALVLIAAVKGSILVAAAWAAMRAFPRLSAALRHLVWASALGGLVLMPILVRVVPSLQSRYVPAIPVVTSIQTTEIARAPIVNPIEAERSRSSMPNTSTTERIAIAAPRHSIDLEKLFPIVWAAVAGLLLLRMAFGRVRLALLARDASVVDDGKWLLLAQRLAHRLDISRPITLLRSRTSCVPMTWGLVYPTVLLPADADEWTDERRTIVLLHELAHVNRLDAFTQFVAQLATAIFWFNPLAWLAARAMRIERELACDDCVLANGARASDYAQDLLQIARTFSTRSDLAVAALAMARRGDLEDRLLAILDPATNRSTVSRARLVGATVVIFAVSIPLAALTSAPVQAAERTLRVVATAASSPAASVSRRDSVTVIETPTFSGVREDKDIARILDTPVAEAPRTVKSSTIAMHIASLAAAVVPKIDAPRAAQPDRETLISVAHAAVKLTSSYDKAELLVPIAKYYLADDELTSAYVAAAASISSDYDCSRTFSAFLVGNAPLADKTVETAMGAIVTRRMSDYEKNRVITATLGDGRVLGPDARRAVIAAISTISASYDRRAAISSFITRRQFNESDAIGLINAASKISGSYDRAEALIDIAAHHGLDDAGVRQAYMKATESISSSSDYRRAVEALVKRP